LITDSLGVVFYEMLTGKLPFIDDNYMKILQKHLYETPELPSIVNPDLPKDIDDIVMKSLAKEPENRYASMLEFVTDMKLFYKKHGLEKKQNLAFVFNSTAIVDLSLNVIEKDAVKKNKKKSSLTNDDVLRMLNKGTVVNPNKSDISDNEYKKSNKNMLLLVLVVILSIFSIGSVVYFYFFNKQPMVIKRIQKSTKTKVVKEKNIHKKRIVRKKYHKSVFVKKRKITLTVLSNVKDVVVFNRDTKRRLCVTPCKIKLNKSDSAILLLGFKKEGYNIQPKAIRLNQDMKLTVNLK
jgi:flagellar basal body-associated protein FliL